MELRKEKQPKPLANSRWTELWNGKKAPQDRNRPRNSFIFIEDLLNKCKTTTKINSWSTNRAMQTQQTWEQFWYEEKCYMQNLSAYFMSIRETSQTKARMYSQTVLRQGQYHEDNLTKAGESHKNGKARPERLISTIIPIGRSEKRYYLL